MEIKKIRKKMYNNGITLIALIITVIVLLILAGVTINLTLGENGIFKTAEMAGKNYTQAQEQELAGLANFENEINNIIAKTEDGSVEDNTLKSKAQPGDYIKYEPTAKTFSMTPEQTGQDANQDFNTGDYTGLWQVLYNDDTHGLQIISVDIVGELTLGHDDSDGDSKTRTEEDEEKVIRAYNNSINTLNSFSRNYVDERYAISGRSVGSDSINPDNTVTELYELPFIPNGYESGITGAYISNITHGADFGAMETAKNQNENGIYNIENYYWLASRNVYLISLSADFSLYYVNDDGRVISNGAMWQCMDDGRSYPWSRTMGVRPVVTLKSGIQISNGNGTESLPYELVAM